jgi:hypothetical protein
MGIRCATPLYQQNLALTSSTSGGLSVGRVRSRTKATELLLLVIIMYLYVVALFPIYSSSRKENLEELCLCSDNSSRVCEKHATEMGKLRAFRLLIGILFVVSNS